MFYSVLVQHKVTAKEEMQGNWLLKKTMKFKLHLTDL